MASLATQDNPELDTITLRMPSKGLQIDKFEEYSYEEDFFTPTDAWHFRVSASSVSAELDAALVPGTAVQLAINGNIQSTGTISAVERSASRGNGSTISISGYDFLGPAVDAHVNPNLKFSEGQTVFDVISSVYGDFGISSFGRDNDANLNVITGQMRGAKATKKGRALKSFTLHQLKPYEREGAFQFCARIAERFGLWTWPDSQGQTLILGKPSGLDDDGTYTLPSIPYQLVRKVDSNVTNNIIDGSVRRDAKRQPSCILARGVAGGGEFAKASIRSAIINPAITTDLTKIKAAYPKLVFKTLNVPGIVPYVDKYARPLYLKDDEAHTQEQLDCYVRRELSKLLFHHLTASYTIKGHTIGGMPVAVDTIVHVDDDIGRLHGPMWVLGRHFSKSRGGGTTSALSLCLPGTVRL